MRLWSALAGALLLAGCATSPRQGADRQWLVGSWLMLGAGVEYPLSCRSGLPISYRADGGYRLSEERGSWRLEGSRLTEIATEIQDSADSGDDHRGRPFVSRIERRGTDEFRKTFADGRTATFRRCPAG